MDTVSRNAKCAFSAKHEQWGIPSDSQLVHQSKLSVTQVEEICQSAQYVLSSYEKKKRPLRFCTGCMLQVQSKIKGQGEDQFEVLEDRDEQSNGYAHFEFGESPNVANSASEDGDYPHKNVIDLDDPDLDGIIQKLPSDQLTALAFSLGKALRQNMKRSSEEVSSKYKDLQYVSSFDIDEYYHSQFVPLRSFIEGVQDSKQCVDRYASAKIVESIMYLVNPIIFPLHFREMLVLYNMCKSKTALQMLSSRSPYPSYTSIRRWLEALSVSVSQRNPQIMKPIGSIVIAMDNNQILKKKWSIKVANKCYSTVVTMVVGFEMDRESVMETDANMKPTVWQTGLLEEQVDMIKKIDRDPDVKRIHYEKHLLPYVNDRLQKVVKEQEYVDGKWMDLVDNKIEELHQSTVYKTCVKCGFAENKKSCRKCQVCGESLSLRQATTPTDDKPVQVKQKHDVRVKVKQDGTLKHTHERSTTRAEYSRYECINTNQCPKTYVLKPSMVNPNSYESIRKVLQDIGKEGAIKKYGNGNREFLLLYCDGVPYTLIQRVIRCTFRCEECQLLLNSKIDCQKHTHDGISTVFDLEFDWVLVLPGGGHIEMNMVRSFVELMWPVCWKEIVILFNFRSETALRSAQKVSDHHKGWTICRIFRHAVTDELLLPYVRQALEKGESQESAKLSASDFFRFVAEAIDPNYVFMADAVFELLDSIFMLRVGVRTGQKDFIHSAKAKFGKVWVGRKHPLYRELIVQDLLQRVQMPMDLGLFVDQSMSLNITGVPYTGESPDFRLEEINKQVQQFMPLVPKESDWEKVCANYDTLVGIKRSVIADKGIGDLSSFWQARKPQDIEDEELAVRMLFRKKKYLGEPGVQKEHISVSGEKLSDELVHFCDLAAERYSEYVDAVTVHNETSAREKPCPVKTDIKPIYVTNEEKQKSEQVENMTKLEIETLIYQQIDCILDKDMRANWLDLWERMSGKSKKKEYLEFLEELHEYSNELVSTEVTCTSDEEETHQD